MSNFIKKSLLTLAIIPGLLMIIVVIVANKVTDGFDDVSIDIITKYVFEFRGMAGMQEIINSDVGIMFVMYKISDYSHWILTASIIWVVIFLYLIGNIRRPKGEKREEV